MKLGNAIVISFINLKGGVGKTTSAVNVAATLANQQFIVGKTARDARVLLIDLDPQGNATLSLINHSEYKQIENHTIVQLFHHELNRDDQAETFDPTKIRITPIPELNLDLIPSSLDLFDIQDELVRFKRYYLSATDILYNALNNLKDPEGKAYTHVIIDCPPSLGLVTLNGLAISNYYIVPTLLDAYSFHGLDKIFERVATLKRCKTSCRVELLGVLFSRVNKSTSKENNIWKAKFKAWEARNIKTLRNRSLKKNTTFTTEISNADVIRKAQSKHQPVITYTPPADVKKAQNSCQQEWSSLVQEILERI